MPDREAAIDSVDSAAHGNESLPSAHEILTAVAALAQHLQACGVAYLPRPNPDAVAQLQSGFAMADASQENAPQQVASRDVSTSPSPHLLDEANAASRVPTTAARASGVSRLRPAPLIEPTATYDLPILSREERIAKLDHLRGVVATCQHCPSLANGRIQTVFGEGNPTARVVFFGEAPGAEEDRSGRPFVGRAGELLTKMIQACTFPREDTYILNTIKCRPPGNRNPEPTEIANCRDYFEQQLAILQPEYIVCLGAIAAQTLLQTTEPVGRLRGRWHQYFASKVLVTYHPSYLLRNPAAKKAAWEDLKRLLADMGIQPR